MPDDDAVRLLPSTQRIPWFVAAPLVGVTAIVVGALWDISWHSTIGRDTFWTPAHMVIYFGGVLAGLSCGWAIFRSTFPHVVGVPVSEARGASVSILGARGPLGAWVVIWGALAMLTSAPFDDWWHNAYGLDVEILSPPHSVLAAGIFAIGLGALMLVASLQNRSAGARAWLSGTLCAYAVGTVLCMAMVFLTEWSFPNSQHGGRFYLACCLTYPFYLALAARSSTARWPATLAAATSLILILSMAWILPLFPATPLLAPIYNRVDHMVPPVFPPLVIVPAIAFDLLARRNRDQKGLPSPRVHDWALAVVLGVVFFAVFLAVQWNFSTFLLSPAADNWFFSGGRSFPFFEDVGDFRYRFWHGSLTFGEATWSLLRAVIAARVGLWCGTALARVMR